MKCMEFHTQFKSVQRQLKNVQKDINFRSQQKPQGLARTETFSFSLLCPATY